MHANSPRPGPWHHLQVGVLATTLAFLGGCESIPKSLADVPFADKLGLAPAPSLTAALAPPSERTWPDSAQDVLNQRARGFGLVNAPDMQRYLNALYARIKTQAGVGDWQGGVHILATDGLQAYATGAGNLYVSLSWLNSVQSEDELVALLSHEFGHVYLHYHKLEGAVADADTAVGIAGMGMTLVQNTAQATGWTNVDSLMTAYSLGRGLVTTIYGRSQESAADNFGLNVSLKLGYSYEHGMKAFLERQASWEEANERREKDQQAKILEAVRKQSMLNSAKQKPAANNPLSQSLDQSKSEFTAGLNSAMQQLTFDMKALSDKIKNEHPPIVERIDVLAEAMAAVAEPPAEKDALIHPLEKVRKEKRMAALLANYELAFAVIGDAKNPKSLEHAKKATTGVTATHALPLFALYTALNEQPAAARRQKLDPGQVLETNFSSEPDRAWKIYQERSSRLKEGRQTAAAKKVMDLGLGYFQNAEEVWPDAIHFYGETQGWDEAKRMAKNCSKNFRFASSRCNKAAASPAEIADATRKDKEKADQIAKKISKTQ